MDCVLTGRKRFRVASLGFFRRQRLLVLQVEERYIETTCIGGYIDSEWVTRWRDADLTDLPLPEINDTPGEQV